LLAYLLFWIRRFVAHEIDGQVVELAARRTGQHVLDGSDQPLGLQVARTQAVATGIQRRHVFGVLVFGVIGVAFFARILCTFGDRRTHFAHQRQVFRQRLVGTFQYGHALLAFQHMAEQVAGEGAVHGDIDHADFDLAVVAQPVGDGGGLYSHAALAEDEVVGIVAAIGVDAVVLATGQCFELFRALIE
jgi:hypothetical protein